MRSLRKVSEIIQVACQLHNYVIDKDGINFDKVVNVGNKLKEFDVHPLWDEHNNVITDNNNRFRFCHPHTAQQSTRQNTIVKETTQINLWPPKNNINRNNNLDNNTVYTVDSDDEL